MTKVTPPSHWRRTLQSDTSPLTDKNQPSWPKQTSSLARVMTWCRAFPTIPHAKRSKLICTNSVRSASDRLHPSARSRNVAPGNLKLRKVEIYFWPLFIPYHTSGKYAINCVRLFMLQLLYSLTIDGFQYWYGSKPVVLYYKTQIPSHLKRGG